MSRLMRDGAAKPVCRDQVLGHSIVVGVGEERRTLIGP